MAVIYITGRRQSMRGLEREPMPTPEFRRHFARYDDKTIKQLWAHYLSWRKLKLQNDYELFDRYRKEALQKSMEDMEKLPNPFRNGKKGGDYSCTFLMPASVKLFCFAGLKEAGLQEVRDPGNPRLVTVQGKPEAAGEYEIKIYYTGTGHIPETRQKVFTLQVNPDPRELWRDIPCDPEMEYPKPDTAAAEISGAGARLLAASRRGRSHAHTGLARDDDFAIGENNGWNILIVADGAGSAEFSRRGSQIACQSALEFCIEKSAPGGKLDEFFNKNAAQFATDADLLAAARKTVYEALPGAAFAAHSKIGAEAREHGRTAKMYATTLLLIMAKKYAPGWVILSWQVGDGAMAALCRTDEGLSATLLAEPDEGEYGGQTRFITMKEMFEPNELMRRIRVDLARDVESILLMTDGISDAWFATLANLRKPESWREFWRELQPALKSDDPPAALLEWLNFWSQGNHDDRTLALLLPEREQGE